MGACKSKENVTEAGKKTEAPAPEKAEGADAAKAEAPAAEPVAEAPAADAGAAAE